MRSVMRSAMRSAMRRPRSGRLFCVDATAAASGRRPHTTKGPAQAPIPLCVKRENYFFFAAFFLVAFFAPFFFLAAMVLSPGKEGFIPADPPVDRWVMRKH